jgi:hypothetical protein
MVKYLLSVNADVWATDDANDRQTVAHLSVTNITNSSRTVKDDEILKLLLAHDSALVMARDCRLTTPIHHAAGAGRLNAVRILLDYGADVNARDMNQLTPLHAIWANIIGVSFIEVFAVNFPRILGKPLKAFNKKRMFRCRDFLIEKGADTTALFDGVTPSKYAFKFWLLNWREDLSQEIFRRSDFRSFDGAKTDSVKAWHAKV